MRRKPWRWLGNAGKEVVLFQCGLAEVLVDHFPADPVVVGEDDFRDPGAGALDQLGRQLRCQGLLPPFVGAALLGQGDAFALAFSDQGPFEFGEGAHD